MGQLGLEPVPIWDAGTAGGGFTCSTTALVPLPILKSFSRKGSETRALVGRIFEGVHYNCVML